MAVQRSLGWASVKMSDQMTGTVKRNELLLTEELNTVKDTFLRLTFKSP